MGTSISPAILVVGALTLNATVGGVQRLRAEKALSALSAGQQRRARLVRRNDVVLVPAGRLRPGQVIELETGDVVPADVRLTDTAPHDDPRRRGHAAGRDSTSRARRHHEPAGRSSTRQCQPARRGPRAAQGADRLGPSWPGDRTRPSCQPGPYRRPPAADSRPDHRRTGRRLARCSPFGLRHRAPSDQLSPRAVQPCGPHPASESRGSGPPWTCWPSRSCCCSPRCGTALASPSTPGCCPTGAHQHRERLQPPWARLVRAVRLLLRDRLGWKGVVDVVLDPGAERVERDGGTLAERVREYSTCSGTAG